MKDIQTSQDLPSTDPACLRAALHVGRPNIGSREAFIQYVDDIFERRG